MKKIHMEYHWSCYEYHEDCFTPCNVEGDIETTGDWSKVTCKRCLKHKPQND